ncbi:Aste57867_11157 [Aphanomyces stellatus]|uniref:Aste57867_11157 protein n=1 Tax=Aphanomyces stellatus TaxID=120398 RepID=A0A485KTE6_9STRA|nr:hypothetical protein As57867_011115 [Aphanomyces stellatus]VFT88024.1 Aste57867_11157 [Aphanomyces stellatus]
MLLGNVLNNVINTLDDDNLDYALDFLLEVRKSTGEDLAIWCKKSSGPLEVAKIVVATTFFPVQQCMFTALCLILCGLAKGNFRQDFERLHGRLPPIFHDALPLTSENDLVNPIKIRERLNNLNGELGRISSFRVSKCWIQEGNCKPQRVKTEGWVDFGGNTISLCRDDETLSVLRLPYTDICDIKFNTKESFGRLYFRANKVHSIGLTVASEHFILFREDIQRRYLNSLSTATEVPDICENSCDNVCSPCNGIDANSSPSTSSSNEAVNHCTIQEDEAKQCPAGVSPEQSVPTHTPSNCSETKYLSQGGTISWTSHLISGIDDDLVKSHLAQSEWAKIHDALADEIRVKASTVVGLFAEIGAKQLDRGHALRRLEYQVKTLAHDLQTTKVVTLPRLRDDQEKFIQQFDKAITEAKMSSLSFVNKTMDRIDDECAVNSWTKYISKENLIAVASPWILFGALTSMGYI